MLIFNWIGTPHSINAVQLDHIGNASDAKAPRNEAQRGKRLDIAARFAPATIDTLMQQSSGSREIILAPYLLNMNEGTLARTKAIMLQRRHHHQFIIGNHNQRRSIEWMLSRRHNPDSAL